MPRHWTILLLAIGAIASSPSFAQSQRCNLDRIRTELMSSERFPSLIGCRPNDVRPILESRDYRFAVERQVTSETIREGRIASQRVDDGLVFVDVSTGPAPRQREQSDGRAGEFIGQLLGRAFEEAVNSSRNRQPPPQEPYREPAPQAPDQDLQRVIAGSQVPQAAVIPQPAPPPRVVTTVIVPPPPATDDAQPVRTAEQEAAQASNQPEPVDDGAQSQTAPVPITEVTELTAVPPADTPNEPPTTIPPDVPPPPVTRFIIRGSSSIREGKDLVLTIRREAGDGRDHRLVLDYSDPALLVSPPPTFDFRANMPDEVALPLRTAAVADGDHRLRVSLVGAGRAEVGEPAFVTAVILDRSVWWLWPAALAAAVVAAASLAKIFAPRATCSIENGGVDLGARPLTSRWPDIRVETLLGDASSLLPSPLPIGRRTDVEPSPA